MKLEPHEHDLVGHWLASEHGLVKDRVSERIDALIAGHLVEVATDSSGWDVLYLDPGDGRLWELTYPDSESMGGGPPRLTCVDPGAARRKYGLVP